MSIKELFKPDSLTTNPNFISQQLGEPSAISPADVAKIPLKEPA
jgi:hypothetical protein